MKLPKSIKGNFLPLELPTKFEPTIAGRAIVDGLLYLKKRLEWSGTEIAYVLHLPPNTLNTWLSKGNIPINNSRLSPDIQAIIHLLAIHRSLEAMFDDPIHQREWLSTMHPTLNVIPKERMAESFEGLTFIRQYLDYIRGRGA